MARIGALVVLLWNVASAGAQQLGTAEQAKAMLDRAVSALKSNESTALSEFNDPNNKQFHDRDLYVLELLEHLKTLGFALAPGQLGENITTRRIDLPRLDAGTLLQLGTTALVRITGLREPCIKIARFQKGLQKVVTAKRDGRSFMRGSVMGVVVASGEVSAGDAIHIRPPGGARSRALHPV